MINTALDTNILCTVNMDIADFSTQHNIYMYKDPT